MTGCKPTKVHRGAHVCKLFSMPAPKAGKVVGTATSVPSVYNMTILRVAQEGE